MIIAPPSRLEVRRCARCNGARERQDVWIIQMYGRLSLHADCAQGLFSDLEEDLRTLLQLTSKEVDRE